MCVYVHIYVCWRINAEIERVELNGSFTVKMKESGNEDWTENSLHYCHVEERMGVKRRERMWARRMSKETEEMKRYRKRKLGGKEKKEEAENRTRQKADNGMDQGRERQLKGDKMEEGWRGGKETATTNVAK